MARKIKIEVEISGIEGWSATWDNSQTITRNLRSIGFAAKRALADALTVRWEGVEITNIELINDQPETTTE